MTFSTPSVTVTLRGTQQELAPPAPARLTLVGAQDDYVDLSWIEVYGAVRYEVYADDVFYGSYVSVQNPLRVHGQTSGQQHTFYVKTFNIYELSSKSNEIIATPLGSAFEVFALGLLLTSYLGYATGGGVIETTGQFVRPICPVLSINVGAVSVTAVRVASVAIQGLVATVARPVVTFTTSWAPPAGYATLFHWNSGWTAGNPATWAGANGKTLSSSGYSPPTLDGAIPGVVFDDSGPTALKCTSMTYSGAILVGVRVMPKSSSVKGSLKRVCRFSGNYFYVLVDNSPATDKFGLYNGGNSTVLWGPSGSIRDSFHSVLWWFLSSSSLGIRHGATEVTSSTAGQYTTYNEFAINDGQSTDNVLQAVVVYNDSSKFDTVAKRDAIITALNSAGTAGATSDSAAQIQGLGTLVLVGAPSLVIQTAVDVPILGFRSVVDKGIISAFSTTAPQWVSPSAGALSPLVVGDNMNVVLSYTGSPTPSVVLVSGALPDGAGLVQEPNNTRIAGVVTRAMLFGFTLRLVNGTGGGADRAFTIDIQQPAVIIQNYLDAATVGVAWSQQLTASGHPATFTFSKISGHASFSISSSGLCSSSTPPAAGDYTIVLGVTNGVQGVAQTTFTWQVVTTPQTTLEHDFTAGTLVATKGGATTIARSGAAYVRDGINQLWRIPANAASMSNARAIWNRLPAVIATGAVTLEEGRYCLKITGSGSVTVSGAGASGVANSATPLQFNTTGGDVTFTVSGTVSTWWCYQGTDTSTPYVDPAVDYGTGVTGLRWVANPSKIPGLLNLPAVANLSTHVDGGEGWSGIVSVTQSGVTIRGTDGCQLYKVTAAASTAVHGINGENLTANGVGDYTFIYEIEKTSAYGVQFIVAVSGNGFFFNVDPNTGSVTASGTAFGTLPITNSQVTILNGQSTWVVVHSFTVSSVATIFQSINRRLPSATASTYAASNYADDGTGYYLIRGPWVYKSRFESGVALIGESRGAETQSTTLSGEFLAGEGTLYCVGVTVPATNDLRTIVAIDGTNNPRIAVTSDNHLHAYIGGQNLDGGILSVPATLDIAFGWKSGQHVLATNLSGIVATNAATVSGTANATKIYQGTDVSGLNSLRGSVQKKSLYNLRLSDSAITSLLGSPPPPSGSSLHWYPGHYIRTFDSTDRGQNGLSNISNLLSYGLSNFVGFAIQVDWGDIETSKGVFYWTRLDAMFAACKSAGKRVILKFEDRTYWAGPNGKFVPAYIPKSTGASPACSMAKIWLTSVITEEIRVVKTIVDRYKNDSYFVGIIFNETVIDNNTSLEFGSNPALAIDEYTNLQLMQEQVGIQGEGKVFVGQYCNWPYNGQVSYFENFANNAISKGYPYAMGWPDSKPSYGSRTDRYGSWYKVARDRNTQIIVAAGNECWGIDDETSHSEDCYQLIVNNVGAHIMIWDTYCKNWPTYFQDSVIATVNAHNGYIANTANPYG